jgi:hypothetical protein
VIFGKTEKLSLTAPLSLLFAYPDIILPPPDGKLRKPRRSADNNGKAEEVL